MTNVDQFESVFRSAAKEVYVPGPIEARNVLLLHDLPADRFARFEGGVRRFLSILGPEVSLTSFDVRRVAGLDELLAEVQGRNPDLIATYRGLASEGWRHPYSLGERLDLLTQATPFPVLVVPHPGLADLPDGASTPWVEAPPDLSRVMALTDHLAGEGRLIDWAHAFVKHEGGTLLLVHVEDQLTYERYIEAISKIPGIDTDEARESLGQRLLKDPADYIDSCRKALLGLGEQVEVIGEVSMGQRLGEIRRLITAHDVDLVVMNTKDDDQLAMHGLAHPLAVELRGVAILML